jgi:hypothetical protein
MYAYNHIQVFKDTDASKGVQGKNILLFTHPQNTLLLQNVEVDFHKGWTWLSADVVNQLLQIVRPSACHRWYFQPWEGVLLMVMMVLVVWKNKQTNMTMSHCQALSKPKLLTKLLYHYFRGTAMVSMINRTFWTSNYHCFTWNKGFQPCRSQLQIWKQKQFAHMYNSNLVLI